MVIDTRKVGSSLAKIGAKIWDANSKQFSETSTAAEQWDELNKMGRFGFRVMRIGFVLMGIKPADIERIQNNPFRYD